MRATANVTVLVERDPRPIWWREISAPPPADWVYVFEDFTGDDTGDSWALAAAIFVAQARRRSGRGPTFAELFTHLLPDTAGLPGPFPVGLEFVERRRAISSFRGHVAIDWRRRSMINWDRDVTRSLRVGRDFRELSRARQLSRRRDAMIYASGDAAAAEPCSLQSSVVPAGPEVIQPERGELDDHGIS